MAPFFQEITLRSIYLPCNARNVVRNLSFEQALLNESYGVVAAVGDNNPPTYAEHVAGIQKSGCSAHAVVRARCQWHAGYGGDLGVPQLQLANGVGGTVCDEKRETVGGEAGWSGEKGTLAD